MCHVLIIEDEAMTAMLIEDILSAEGATSFSLASTEREAIDLAVETPPALITSDVKLLEETGPSAVQEIHRRLGDVPVIFITATPDACVPCNPPGRVLTKPMRCGEVASAFHDLGPI